jgi:hypothetical protein
MDGKAKIEGLTNSWYGFAVFSAIFSVLTNGLGIWSISTAIAGLLFSWILTFFIGRALVKKSSLTRAILLLVSGFWALFGTLSVGKGTWAFVHTWEFSLLAAVTFSAVSAWMNAKSFRTLTDSSVKAYFSR